MCENLSPFLDHSTVVEGRLRSPQLEFHDATGETHYSSERLGHHRYVPHCNCKRDRGWTSDDSAFGDVALPFDRPTIHRLGCILDQIAVRMSGAERLIRALIRRRPRPSPK